MSWIQENRFAAGLGGITAVAAAGLIFWGIKAGGSYNQAKDDYTAAADEVDLLVKGPLYPSDDNLKAKTKAVSEYEKSVNDLQEAFTKFRTATPPNVEQDVFIANLLKAKEVAAKAFSEVRPTATELPAEFSMGNETYTTSPPPREATGILTYELDAISELMANLAAAAPTKLLNIHRPQLEEESKKVFDAKGKSFRALPVEISFEGNEGTLRKFLSSLDDSKKHYYVVRSMRVINEKLKAPTAADGEFKTEEGGDAPAGGGAAPAADPFGGGFVLPGEEPAAPPAGGGATPPAPGAGAAAAPSADGVILEQVLGAEKISVFLRIDIIQFLEAPKSEGAKAGSPKAEPAKVEAEAPKAQP